MRVVVGIHDEVNKYCISSAFDEGRRMVKQRRRKQGSSRSMGKETSRSKDFVHLVDHSQVE